MVDPENSIYSEAVRNSIKAVSATSSASIWPDQILEQQFNTDLAKFVDEWFAKNNKPTVGSMTNIRAYHAKITDGGAFWERVESIDGEK